MNAFRELSKEFIEQIRKQYENNRQVTRIEAKHIALFKNGEIKTSDSDYLFEKEEIECAFIFPRIYYMPQTKPTDSYLNPRIISSDYQVFDSEYKNGDWHISFSGQDISYQRHPMGLHISHRNSFQFTQNLEISGGNFEVFCLYIWTLAKCGTAMEARFLRENFELQDKIEVLHSKNIVQEAEIRAKELAIEGYTELLDSIKELVQNE